MNKSIHHTMLQGVAPVLMLGLMLGVAILAIGGWRPQWRSGRHRLEEGVHLTSGPVSPAWLAVFEGTSGTPTSARFVLHSPDGQRVLVAGTSDRGLVAMAYAADTGEPLWTARHVSRGANGGSLVDAVLCPAGERLYLTGWTNGPRGPSCFMVAYGVSNGRLLWEVRQGGANASAGRRLSVSPDGSRLFLLAHQEGEARQCSALVQAHSSRDGRLLWANELPRPAGWRLAGGALAVGTDGQTLVYAGSLYHRMVFGGWSILAFDAGTGIERWNLSLGPKGENKGEWKPTRFHNEYRVIELAASPAGDRFFVIGTGVDRAGELASLVAMSLAEVDGEPQWIVTQSQTDQAYPLVAAMAPAADGTRLFVAAKRHVRGLDTGVVRVTALAAEDGRVHLETEVAAGSPKFPAPVSLRAGADGGALVMAGAGGEDDLPFLIIGWNVSNGGELWRVRTGATAAVPGLPRGLSLSADGREVAVTGRLAPHGRSHCSFTTVTYRLEAPEEPWPDADGPAFDRVSATGHPPGVVLQQPLWPR